MNTPLQRARLSDIRQPSQEEVAAAVGMAQGHYSRLERGLCQASPAIAEKLANFFGRRISELEVLYPERFADSSEAA